MRLRRALIIGLTAAATALQAAAAADTSTVRFLVTVRGIASKHWTYTATTRSDDCVTRINGSGTRTIALKTSDASIVTASWRPGTRMTFSNPVRLIAGTIKQYGAKTTRTSGADGCEKATHKLTCASVKRSFRNRALRLVSRRPHRLGFRRIKRLVSDDFSTSCPGEPSGVRALAGGLELADATVSERDLFDRTTAGVTLQGSAELTTKLLNSPATVVQKVRWTMTLRRLGG